MIEFIPKGWLCPRCDKIWSPNVTECYTCNTKCNKIQTNEKLDESNKKDT